MVTREERLYLMPKIYMQINGHLEEVRRIEVQESNIIGQNFYSCCMRKPTKQQLIIAPTYPRIRGP